MGRLMLFTVKPPRPVTSSRRGTDVTEYRVLLAPTPDSDLRARYNAARDAALPRLAPYSFKLLCRPEQLAEKMDLIETKALPLLQELWSATAEVT
jgi:hypothetical protein